MPIILLVDRWWCRTKVRRSRVGLDATRHKAVRLPRMHRVSGWVVTNSAKRDLESAPDWTAPLGSSALEQQWWTVNPSSAIGGHVVGKRWVILAL
jgi:hypothetical protein